MKKKQKKRIERRNTGYGEGEISIKKFIFYNLLFIIPIIIFLKISDWIAVYLMKSLNTTHIVAMQILMMGFTFVLFAVIIAIIRRRENIRGVRFSLFGFLIFGVALTLPSLIIKKDPSLLFMEFIHIAHYILLTFIFCPEVLGMDVDISKWFRNYRQWTVILVYTAIIVFYMLGFAYTFYTIAKTDPSAFNYSAPKEITYSQFIYFSIVSFATIGYGDITPVNEAARFLVGIEAILGSIINVIFVAILFVYISNFQIFSKSIQKEEKDIKKEEKMIKEEEKILKKEEQYIKKVVKKKPKKNARKR